MSDPKQIGPVQFFAALVILLMGFEIFWSQKIPSVPSTPTFATSRIIH